MKLVAKLAKKLTIEHSKPPLIEMSALSTFVIVTFEELIRVVPLVPSCWKSSGTVIVQYFVPPCVLSTPMPQLTPEYVIGMSISVLMRVLITMLSRDWPCAGPSVSTTGSGDTRLRLMSTGPHAARGLLFESQQ